MIRVDGVLADPGYPALKEWVLNHTGLRYYQARDEDLAARLLRRMERLTNSCTSYLALLTAGPNAQRELDALIGELTIGETYFFRQREQFEFIRTTIVPEILQRKAGSREIRIWSAGCATGAEPYSLSLLLLREFGTALADWHVSILGTDINVDFLAQARTGVFGQWALRDVPDDVKASCFQPEGRVWQVRATYRKNVTFAYSNLASSHPYPGSFGDPFDLIVCRNVLIYFSRDNIRQIVDRLYGSLAEGGWLLTGHAEADVEIFSRYATGAYSGAAAYRRLPPSEFCEVPPSVTKRAARSPAPAAPLRRARERKTRKQSTSAPTVRSRELPVPEASPVSVEDARLLADSGQFERAGEICRQILDAEPLNAEAHFTLGLVFEHTRSPVEAESAFRRAIYLDRSFSLAHYHCGTVLQSAGRLASARKSFENVIATISSLPAEDPVPCGDGMKAGELSALAEMHLERITRQSRAI